MANLGGAGGVSPCKKGVQGVSPCKKGGAGGLHLQKIEKIRDFLDKNRLNFMEISQKNSKRRLRRRTFRPIRGR